MNATGRAALMTMACTGLALSGCVLPIPHSEMPVAGVAVPRTVSESLKPGSATREDVLHLLGRPDIVHEDGRVFVYHWKMSSLSVLVITPGPATGGQISTAQDFVLLEFDDDGRLMRREFLRTKKLPGDPDETVKRWIEQGPGDSESVPP